MSRVIAVVFVVSSIGCAGTETGHSAIDGISPVTVRLALAASPGESPSADDASGVTFTIDKAIARVRHVELQLPDDGDCNAAQAATVDDSSNGASDAECADDKIRFHGPWTVDLLSDDVAGFVGGYVPHGHYKRMHVRLEPTKAAGAGLPYDATLLVEGSFPHDGQAQRFRMTLKFNEDIRFDAADGLTISGAEAIELLTTLTPAQWFKTLPLSACAADGDIDQDGDVWLLDDGDNQCSGLETHIKQVLKTAGQLDRE